MMIKLNFTPLYKVHKKKTMHNRKLKKFKMIKNHLKNCLQLRANPIKLLIALKSLQISKDYI